jgi:outer membrane protein OmpA-like peptidoglycan-associated protein
VRSYLAVVFSAAALSFGLAACGGHSTANSEASPAASAAAQVSAEPSTEASVAAGAEAGAAASPEAGASAAASPPATEASSVAAAPEAAQTGGTPIPAPTPTADPNILSVSNGTILRSYSPATLDGMNDGNLRNAAGGIGSEIPEAAKAPYVFTFELPGVATIGEFQAALRGAPANGPAPNVAFAVSTTGPDSGFTDVGTITGTAKTLAANTKARWVRVTANQLYDSIGATGSIAPPPAPIKPDGIYVEQAEPDKNGGFVQTGSREGYDRARFVAVGSALVATQCRADTLHATYVGQLDGRRWNATLAGNKDANPATFRGAFNDDGTILAGDINTEPGHYFTRTSEVPAFCIPRVTGTGAHRVLVLDQDPIRSLYPIDTQPPLPGYRFEAIGAGMLDDSMLAGKDAVWVRDVCKAPQLLADEQRALLLQWVAAGHKLIVSGGTCYNGSDFTWLPYPFTSAGPGPESTNASLIQIENSALGTNDKNDSAHFVDVAALVANANNGLSSTAPVTTNDPHWCGHFFVAKTTNLNGFAQMYAVSGSGLIVYDGFNSDDSTPTMQRIRQLELGVPVGADLPCTQHVTDSFILEPNQEATFVAGKAQTIHAPMQILANQGWNGHVAIKTTGDLPASVSPSGFDIAGGTKAIDVAVHVPASAKAGVYTVNALAGNGSEKNAQASVTLTGTAPLVKQFKPAQKRIRIYGIHFDVDSAVIQPRSEPVIAEIAQLLKSEPSLRFQVEGHTDSDGGAAYNLGLSQRRAQAVVDDLVKRYGIAHARLVAKGFGLTKPVASNATEAGKALNRRVELLRL